MKSLVLTVLLNGIVIGMLIVQLMENIYEKKLPINNSIAKWMGLSDTGHIILLSVVVVGFLIQFIWMYRKLEK